MRALFTDGWNSLAHVSLGVIGSAAPVLLASALVYQVATYDDNTATDIMEILIGALFAVTYLSLVRLAFPLVFKSFDSHFGELTFPLSPPRAFNLRNFATHSSSILSGTNHDLIAPTAIVGPRSHMRLIIPIIVEQILITDGTDSQPIKNHPALTAIGIASRNIVNPNQMTTILARWMPVLSDNVCQLPQLFLHSIAVRKHIAL